MTSEAPSDSANFQLSAPQENTSQKDSQQEEQISTITGVFRGPNQLTDDQKTVLMIPNGEAKTPSVLNNTVVHITKSSSLQTVLHYSPYKSSTQCENYDPCSSNIGYLQNQLTESKAKTSTPTDASVIRLIPGSEIPAKESKADDSGVQTIKQASQSHHENSAEELYRRLTKRQDKETDAVITSPKTTKLNDKSKANGEHSIALSNPDVECVNIAFSQESNEMNITLGPQELPKAQSASNSNETSPNTSKGRKSKPSNALQSSQ